MLTGNSQYLVMNYRIKYLISQCRDNINDLFYFERTRGNIPGAYVSLESEIARYIRYNLTTFTFCVLMSGAGFTVVKGNKKGTSCMVQLIEFVRPWVNTKFLLIKSFHPLALKFYVVAIHYFIVYISKLLYIIFMKFYIIYFVNRMVNYLYMYSAGNCSVWTLGSAISLRSIGK